MEKPSADDDLMPQFQLWLIDGGFSDLFVDRDNIHASAASGQQP
jgi:hypothetical protein